MEKTIARLLQGVIPETTSRFTEKQLVYYEKVGESRGLRARCLAGAYLGLKTSSPVIEIKLKLKGRARNKLGLDLEVDGQIIKCVRLELAPGQNLVTERLAERPQSKEREIKIYLPVSVEVEIVSFSACGKPLPTAEEKLLCLGDSITQGMDATCPSCIYPTVLAKLIKAECLNQGVGGQTFDPESLDASLPFSAKVVTVAYGVNDWFNNHSLKEIEENCLAYLERLRKIFPTAVIAVITPIWTSREDETKKAGTLQAVRNSIARIASWLNCFPVDGLALVPHHPFYFVDGIHPNESGHLLYGVNLFQSLSQFILQTKRSPTLWP
ncbi:MAG: SGNH/GDSL hydrolase family protein [Candidatus Omnitrophica bacterium]|nr:SGNH/GDSL hydrolase family protein [Candidatus Omnitrophota bacterium]